MFCLFLLLGIGHIVVTPAQAQTPTPVPTPASGSPVGSTGGTRDPDEYNYLPLILRPELSLDNTGTLQDTLIANMVQDQGYEVHCAAPQWHMHPTLYGEVKKYFEAVNYKGPVYLRGYEDPYIVNMSDSRIAMMRGDEKLADTNKISSLEGIFGVNNPKQPPGAQNSSGAVENLTSFEQQCNIKYGTFMTMWDLCAEKLGNGGSDCFLNVAIPESGGMHLNDLMKGINGARNKFNDATNFCREFVQVYDPAVHGDRMGLTESKWKSLNNALQNYSIDQLFLYRVGFLVVSITQNIDTDNEGEDDVFWFRKHPEDINGLLEAPIVVAFKIPDFATNKSLLLSKYKDTSKILNNIYWKPEIIAEIDKESQRKRMGYMEAISKKRYEYPVIKYCGLYPCRSDPEEILQRAVIDIINGIGTTCGEQYMPIEQAGDIGSPGLVDTNRNRDPNPPYFNYLIGSQRQFKFNWELLVNEPEPPVSGERMRMMAHLVVPLGTDLKYVENTLKALFQPDAFKEMEEKNVMVDYENKLGVADYYPIRNAMTKFVGTDPSHKYTDYTAEPVCDYNKFGFWECKYPTKEFQASVIETGKQEFRILGARLGWMVRKIQENIRQPHLQIKCTRTEDLFLGRCQIEPLGEDETAKCDGEAFKKIKGLPPSSGIPAYAQSMYTSEIEPKITKDVIEAYEYAEKETGIPCEVVAGIHWTEGGNDPSKSVFDGGSLRGTLKEDAKAAMEHLITFWPGGFNKDNITYEALTTAIGGYNGPGNMNCSYDQSNNQRQTRWRMGGKCEAKFQSEDHPHPLGWIDERHSDMDLIYCLDYTEFSCNVDPNSSELDKLREHLATTPLSPEQIEEFVTRAATYCYSTSSICQSLAEGRKYPKYERPGSITTAILLHESGAANQ